MKIKICGITNKEDAVLCSDLGADAIGFIFYASSKRNISFDTAGMISKELPSFINRVGVFVNESEEIVKKAVEKSCLTVLQFHGDESPEYCNSFNLPVIKAFRINNNFDFSQLCNYTNTTFLLDTYDKSLAGGTGIKFNWELIPEYLHNKIILSGGITIQDAGKIKSINPYGIDVSSAVEKEPGIKCHKKLNEFIKVYKNLQELSC